MRILRLELENWKNFQSAAVDLPRRVFLVGPNASGKSNFLDAIRFLRDIADPQGGLIKAVTKRGGVSQIRSFAARKIPEVKISTSIGTSETGVDWIYEIKFKSDSHGRPILRSERVVKSGKELFIRPSAEDKKDPERLRQTLLEQVSSNQDFREINDFLRTIKYFHLVPQLVREPDRSIHTTDDPFGGDFISQIARIPEKTRIKRLTNISKMLNTCIPNLKELSSERDEITGKYHLKAQFEQWRPKAGWQTEDQLSDGTLRMIGFLWSILEGEGPLLLEEPELSLHTEIIKIIPRLIYKLTVKKGRQVIISTHSTDMFSDKGVSASEILLLIPKSERTEIKTAALLPEIQTIIDNKLPLGSILSAKTAPKNINQLSLLFD